MLRRRSLRVTAAIVLATGMTSVAAGPAGASAAPQPAIAVAGVAAAGLTVVVAAAPHYAVTVTNVGDAVATASGDDPSSIAIEGASAGAVVSGAGLRCIPGDDEIDCAFEPALAVAPGEAVVVNVDGATADAAGGGAIFSVTADFNGAESSVDVSTSGETYDTATSADSASALVPAGVQKKKALPARHAAAGARGPVLTPVGVGHTRVGMTLAQARRASGRTIVDGADITGGCRYANVPSLRVSLMLLHGRIARIDVDRGSPVRALGGIHRGDTEADVRAAFGAKVVETRHAYVRDGSYLTAGWHTGRYAGRGIRFETNAKGTVTDIYAGRRDPIRYVEGCS